MKKILIILTITFSTITYSQSFNEDKITFTNFLKRMYTASPFEGVKIVDDYDREYLLSVISLDKTKYTNPSIMNRVAQVKSQSQASTFLNGATISMDMIITINETTDATDNVTTIVKTVEQIKQNSMGFSQGLELLTNFDSADSRQMVFFYFREIK